MKLDVPLILQKKNSADCGLACLSMVLAYYGQKVPTEVIKKSIKMYAYGTYSGQLGKYLQENGFDVTITTLNPGLFTLADKKLNQKEILAKFEADLQTEKKKGFQITLRHLISFMKAGGKIEVKIPDASDLSTEIEAGRPVIAQLTSQFLKSKQHKFIYHFNVATGFEGDKVFANDSLPDERGGQNCYLMNDFIFGIHAAAAADNDNSCLIKIRKR